MSNPSLFIRGKMKVKIAQFGLGPIGLETLKLLRRENVLNPERRIKITRQEVKRIFRRSIMLYPFRNTWESLAN